MARYAGTTTQRGLGSSHQRARRAALAALRDGDPCARCGHPMYRAQARMLDLDDFPGRAYGGPQVKLLSHRSCNRRAGQAITAAINRARGGLTRRQQAAIRMKQWQAAARQW